MYLKKCEQARTRLPPQRCRSRTSDEQGYLRSRMPCSWLFRRSANKEANKRASKDADNPTGQGSNIAQNCPVGLLVHEQATYKRRTSDEQATNKRWKYELSLRLPSYHPSKACEQRSRTRSTNKVMNKVARTTSNKVRTTFFNKIQYRYVYICIV